MSRLGTLARLTELVSSSRDVDEILRQVVACAAQLIDTRLVSLWVADEAARVVELRASSDEAIVARHPTPRLAYGEGGAGWVAEHRRALKLDDLANSVLLAHDWFLARGLRSMYALPIIHQASFLGILVLFAEQPFDLGPEEHALLDTFIAQAGAALRNARLLAESERRRRAAEALAELSRLCSETLDLETVARRVVDSMCSLLGVEQAGLYRLVPETQDLEALALTGERQQAQGPRAVFPRGTEAVGLAVRERRAIATPNFLADPAITHDPAILERLAGASYRAVLALPLHVKDRVIGALAVCAVEGRVFRADEIRLAQAFADQAALVLENAQLFDDAARRRHEMEVLAEVVGQINGSLELSTILSRIVDGACDLTGADGGQIALVEPGTDNIRMLRRRGVDQGNQHDIPIARGKGAGGLVLATRRPFRTANYADDSRITKDFAERVRAAGIASLLVVPIHGGTHQGLLYVFSRKPQAFTERDEATLSRLADHATIAIGNANLLVEAEGRRREAQCLAEFGRLISQSLEPKEVAQRIVESVGMLLDAGMAALYLLEPDTEDLTLLGVAGPTVPWNQTHSRGTSSAGLAVRLRAPVTTPDALADPRITFDPEARARIDQAGYHAALALPLFTNDRVFGALVVGDRRGRIFQPDEIRLVQTFVDQAVIALDNARLHAETTRRKWEAEILRDVGRLVIESQDADEVSRRIADSLRALLGGQSAAIMRLDPATGDLVGRILWTDGENEALVFPGGTGAIGRAASTRRPVATTDLLTDPNITVTPELQGMLEKHPYRAVLALPMIIDDRVVGVISVGDHAGRLFDADEIRLAQAFIDQATMAIEKARLFQDVEQRRREAEVFAELAGQINASPDPDTILKKVAEAARELCHSDLGGTALRDPDSDAMVMRHWLGARMRHEGVRIVPGQSLGGQVLVTRRPIRTDDYANDLRVDPDHLPMARLEGVMTALVVPIETDERIEGLLYVENRRPRPFTDRDEALLTRLAAQAAIAIHNARLLEARRAYQARLEALLSVSHELSRIQPVDDLLGAVAAACGRVLESESVGFRVVEGDELVVAGLWGDAKETMVTERIKIGESFSGIVAASGTALRVDDMTHDPRVIPAHRDAAVRLGYRAFLGVPVKVGERVTGVLSIRTRRPSGFSKEDQTIAMAFASQAATAMENARLFREVQVAAEEVSRAQDALLQSQKMEAVGRLAGGVAHDFNNLLTIIHGRCEILLKRFEHGAKQRQDLGLIQRTAQRAAALTKQLLAFSRQQVLQPQILSLNTVVGESASMLRRLIGEDITLVTLPGAQRDRVKADPTQLEQVLMNLAINARDAMPLGGRLAIETADVDLDEAFARDHPGAVVGPHVRLSVSDDGVGMSPDVLARIFEPFFTTKDKSRGTGLGLSMVYGIVKQHEGLIDVQSTPGRGTTFSIYLTCAQDVEPQADAGAARGEAARGSETILLVEDEDDVRELTREILEMAGYTVLEAAVGQDALRLCLQFDRAIDVLLTDVVMPQMSGPELARKIAELRPKTKVVYMSGYTDDALGHHGVLDPDIILLTKPFMPESLLNSLRLALDT